MIRKPTADEWDTSRMDRAWLDAELSFEDIAAQASERAAVVGGTIKPYEKPSREDQLKRGAPLPRQPIFIVNVGYDICDLLYNAPDGMRGRYWQSPDHGLLATKHLIARLLRKMLAKHNSLQVLDNAEPMTCDEVRTSLELPSAKLWPAEPLGDWTVDTLNVKRWVEIDPSPTAMWRHSPTTKDCIDIKGALLGTDGVEYVPDGKRDRSYQIFHHGFT